MFQDYNSKSFCLHATFLILPCFWFSISLKWSEKTMIILKQPEDRILLSPWNVFVYSFPVNPPFGGNRCSHFYHCIIYFNCFRNSNKWNHIVGSLLCLVSFILHVFDIFSCHSLLLFLSSILLCEYSTICFST